jgi:hypothetical protein
MKKTVLLSLFALALTACPGTPVKPTTEKLINCAGTAVSAAVVQIMPEVEKALSGQTTDWPTALKKLLPLGEEAVVCAVEAFASGKAQPQPATMMGVVAPLPDPRTARAVAWIEANGYKVQH